MTCCHGPVDDEVVARVTQLINKTNQFNLTTRRFTTEEVKQMARSSEWWCRWFRLSDRFGDHGLVGVMLARIGESAWRVETWLMSCRVLGRGMEEFMAACVLRAAAEARAKMVTGRYEPTAKNEMVRDLYPRMGFTGSGPGNEFRFDLAATPFPLSPWMSSEERSR
jgi:FkbH-like protein